MSAVVDESALLGRLRAGDEAAFVALVDRHHASMVRLAERFVSSRAVAEEVAQESWLGLLRGLGGFEGRSSVRTYLLRTVANVARTRGARESHTSPFSSLGAGADGPTVDPERFLPVDHRWAGHWASDVRPWGRSPEQIVASAALLEEVRAAIADLPPGQRAVIELHDLEGLEGFEICNVLGISAVNQRVLLHRARAGVRRALDSAIEQ